MTIQIDMALFVAMLLLIFLFGLISGIKIAYARLIMQIIKKISPKEFEKLMEVKNESGDNSTPRIGRVHKYP